MNKTFEKYLNQIAADPTLHTSSLYALSKMDKTSLEILERVWPTIDTQRRRDIMAELVEIAEANFEVYFDPVFLLGLGDEDAEVRAVAISGLWEHENPRLINPLIHLLRHDPAARVRAAAANALGRFVYLAELEEIDQEYEGVLKEALRGKIYQANEEIDVRRRAIEAIAYASSDAEVNGIIEGAYYDEDEKMQVSAIFAMGRSADSRWRPQVVAELENPNTEIRFEAARASGELELRDAVPKLIELIDQDPDLEVQEMAIWALGRIGGPVAREALEMCMESDIVALAQAAEEAMDELNLFDDNLLLYDFDENDDLETWDDPEEAGKEEFDA